MLASTPSPVLLHNIIYYTLIRLHCLHCSPLQCCTLLTAPLALFHDSACASTPALLLAPSQCTMLHSCIAVLLPCLLHIAPRTLRYFLCVKMLLLSVIFFVQPKHWRYSNTAPLLLVQRCTPQLHCTTPAMSFAFLCHIAPWILQYFVMYEIVKYKLKIIWLSRY